MSATVRVDPEVSTVAVSAWVERGRDGLDLPFAAIVADRVELAMGRASTWVEPDDEGAAVYVRAAIAGGTAPPGVAVRHISAPWRLDDGWKVLLESQTGAQGVGPGPRVGIVHAAEGTSASLPTAWGGSPDEPWLVVLTGGGSLDARGRGEVFGVMVIDGGDVLLEGTTVHGAVCASGTVDLGADGAVAFSASTLRWASDQSLQRTRVVPGSRTETGGA